MIGEMNISEAVSAVQQMSRQAVAAQTILKVLQNWQAMENDAASLKGEIESLRAQVAAEKDIAQKAIGTIQAKIHQAEELFEQRKGAIEQQLGAREAEAAAKLKQVDESLGQKIKGLEAQVHDSAGQLSRIENQIIDRRNELSRVNSQLQEVKSKAKAAAGLFGD